MKKKKINRRKTIHELLKEDTIEEDGIEEEKDVKIRKETRDEMGEEEIVEENLGEEAGHSEDELQDEEE